METVNEKATYASPVSFSENAVKEIKRLMNEENISANKYLRIGVKGGGCSGMTYILEFDERNANDTDFYFEDLHFVMEKSHQLYLHGMMVDYSDGLNARGFVFNNPNATKTCGCGTSFSV